MRYRFQRFGSSEGSDGSEDVTTLYAEGSIYTISESGGVTESEVPPNRCPRTDDFLLSLLLLCGAEPSEEERFDVRVENAGRYDGQSTLVLVLEESYTETLSGGPLPPPTGGTIPPT